MATIASIATVPSPVPIVENAPHEAIFWGYPTGYPPLATVQQIPASATQPAPIPWGLLLSAAALFLRK
jgi:hypothetical protein